MTQTKTNLQSRCKCYCNEPIVESVLDALPVYRSKSGGETHDLSDAELDPLGRAQLLRYEGSTTHRAYLNTPCLSFDPSDPVSRQAALDDVALMQGMVSQANVYADPMQALQQINNAATKLENNLNNLPKSE